MKHTFKLLAIIIIVWIWMPSGPSDLLFIPWIISKIGKEAYLVISLFMAAWLYNNIEGKGISGKLSTISSEISHLF